jgi:hypothetical protein
MVSDFFVWLNQQPQGTASFIGTLAGSTLGFLALLAGALFNAHLNRSRDNRLRDNDRRVLATALYAELELVREILLENCKTLRQPPNGEDGFFVPPPKVQILPEVIDRLGLLKSDTIKTVTSAYLVIGQYKRELLTLGAQTLNSAENDQLWLDAKHRTSVIRMNTVKADYISKALTELGPYFHMKKRKRP